MTKTTIFISHITEEAELANIIKSAIDRDFLGMVEIFVSTDSTSITLGTKWLDRISEKLTTAAAIIVLCSRESVKRPWINFEAGAGWVKNIPVIPLCHSGLNPTMLPVPLNMLQALNGNDPKKLAELYESVARELGSNAPTPNYASIAQQISDFEVKYRLKSDVLDHLNSIKKIDSSFLTLLKSCPVAQAIHTTMFSQSLYDKLKPYLDQLQATGMLSHHFVFNTIMAGAGNLGNLHLEIQRPLADALNANF